MSDETTMPAADNAADMPAATPTEGEATTPAEGETPATPAEGAA